MSETAPDLGPDGIAARARLTHDASWRGKIIARAVASDPLDHYAIAGQITERQYQAGMRLRSAIAGSWPQPRVTAKAGYVSAEGLDDGEDVPVSEEEEWAQRKAFYDETREAYRIMGAACWPVVAAVCEGKICAASQFWLLQRGLQALADGWKARERKSP